MKKTVVMILAVLNLTSAMASTFECSDGSKRRVIFNKTNTYIMNDVYVNGLHCTQEIIMSKIKKGISSQTIYCPEKNISIELTGADFEKTDSESFILKQRDATMNSHVDRSFQYYGEARPYINEQQTLRFDGAITIISCNLTEL